METRIVTGPRATAPDPKLRATLAAAHGWLDDLGDGTSLAEIARRDGRSESFLRARRRKRRDRA